MAERTGFYIIVHTEDGHSVLDVDVMYANNAAAAALQYARSTLDGNPEEVLGVAINDRDGMGTWIPRSKVSRIEAVPVDRVRFEEDLEDFDEGPSRSL